VLSFVIAALNIYWFLTDTEYAGAVISAGPGAAAEVFAADVAIITETPLQLFKNFKAAGLAASGLEQLAALREDLNLPAAGSALDKSTLAKLVIGEDDWFGINAHGQDVTLSVNAISRTHAETDAFQQAYNDGVTGTGGTLYVDRELCKACGQNGAVKSLARQLGLKQLTIVTPGGTVTWDLTQP